MAIHVERQLARDREPGNQHPGRDEHSPPQPSPLARRRPPCRRGPTPRRGRPRRGPISAKSVLVDASVRVGSRPSRQPPEGEEAIGRRSNETVYERVERIWTPSDDCLPSLAPPVPTSEDALRVGADIGEDVLLKALLGRPLAETIHDALVRVGNDDSTEEPLSEWIHECHRFV